MFESRNEWCWCKNGRFFSENWFKSIPISSICHFFPWHFFFSLALCLIWPKINSHLGALIYFGRLLRLPIVTHIVNYICSIRFFFCLSDSFLGVTMKCVSFCSRTIMKIWFSLWLNCKFVYFALRCIRLSGRCFTNRQQALPKGRRI